MSTIDNYPGPIRRVVTGHTPEGKSFVEADSQVHPRVLGGENLAIDLYWTDKFPAVNAGDFKDTIKDHVAELYGPNGTAFRVVDIPPKERSVSDLGPNQNYR